MLLLQAIDIAVARHGREALTPREGELPHVACKESGSRYERTGDCVATVTSPGREYFVLDWRLRLPISSFLGERWKADANPTASQQCGSNRWAWCVLLP